MKKLVGFVGIFLLCGVMPLSQVGAAELYNISITGSPDINAYEININASDNIPVLTKILDHDKVLVQVRGVERKKIVKTFFENAPEIEHVIVNPVGQDGYEVLIKGKNVANSKIFVDSRYFNTSLDRKYRNNYSAAESVARPSLSVDSPPQLKAESLGATKPVYNDVESNNQLNSIEQLNHSLNTGAASPITETMGSDAGVSDDMANSEFKPAIEEARQVPEPSQDPNSLLQSGSMALAADSKIAPKTGQSVGIDKNTLESVNTLNKTDILLKIIIAVLLLIIVGKFVYDMIKRSIKPSQKHVKIDLSGAATANPYLDQYRNYKTNVPAKSLGKPAKKLAGTMKSSSAGYSKAPLNYNAYGTNLKSSNYGTATTALKQPINLKQYQQTTPKTTLTSPIKTGNDTVTNTRVMDFLQSMSEIYEKSGRPDLAHTVKKSMLKAQKGLV